MADRPIIFSAPMVRALLAGRKTQTRRVLKPQPEWSRNGVLFWRGTAALPHAHKLPYAPGDRLWVREAWRIGAWDGDRGQMCIDFRADGSSDPTWRTVPDPDWFEDQWIRLSDELHRKGAQTDADGHYVWHRGEAPLSWRPSIHMPRWASRLTLTVTDVRVQRVQEISEADAHSEGMPRMDEDGEFGTCRGKFALTWDHLNVRRGYGWDANPWVVALTFTVERTNIDA